MAHTHTQASASVPQYLPVPGVPVPGEWQKALLALMPSWVRVEARLPVLLPPLRDEGYPGSSGSSGVGSGDGKCRLERSGREPPVFRAEGAWGVLDCWSGEGKILEEEMEKLFR